MDKEAITAELTDIIGTFLTQASLELVELILRREGPQLVLRILADRPEGGITIEDCAFINKEISRILDEKNIIADQYLLEVSSPGIDRPLKSKNDFLRSKDKEVRFFLNEMIEGKLEWLGKVKDADEDSVFIEVNGKELKILFTQINKAKQEIL
ncbi:MAG: ribosome maturation factor RimP [Candidatus Omnitrophica bacterium]|nr:ribosome maturation factor RimP [Candidatus Omnitrophota bacterium]MDD5652778.1 ribosome maturation factor RimP [Candidatus Omnitrophota bacterium]